MKINFVAFNMKLTGGTRFIAEMINGLASRGHELNLITFGKLEDMEWIKLNARVIYTNRSFVQKVFGFLYRKAFGFQPWPEEETRRILRVLPEADINIATISYSGFAVHRSHSGAPFHFLMHYEPLVREDWGKKKIIEAAIFLPTIKIANSTWLARQIKENTGREVAGLVFPAIDHDIFYPRKKKRPIQKNQKIKIVSLAKNKWWKGFPDALRAIKLVRDAGYDVEFLGFGNKFDRAALPEEVKNIDFTFVGPKVNNDLAEFYSNADILISASYFESFPLPPLEAMACGTPVVTTPLGTEDYAFDHKNSLVVEARKPELMADALIEIIENQELYLKLVGEGIKTAKSFTWSGAVNQIETIFRNKLQQV